MEACWSGVIDILRVPELGPKVECARLSIGWGYNWFLVVLGEIQTTVGTGEVAKEDSAKLFCEMRS
ncbi:hypothetical protein RLOatenuis_6310 [Rickettsiales bacterium]|nr:hypothetical protein RLOatenuis_6310 [Rickettsiales bacterium]